MPRLRRIGTEAEDQAAAYLLEKGYTIVTRRFKAKHGEIDIVAFDDDLLVFVEVKSTRYAGVRPEDAVDARKVKHLGLAAEEYLAQMGEFDRVFRYDLVSLSPSGIRHHEDAFRGEGRSRPSRPPPHGEAGDQDRWGFE
jgi:putative endonuclease